ncbi:unnamed protein product [Toxocara canis]|uniref:alpha-glucosidase n=1 Tax=Toxocara canis TaxID=6265 RepID=A0A183V7N6_TOXCA|nr:unnamed protein product [Toxocara canis]
MSAKDVLMPGPQGKTPRLYEVEKGHKNESYIVAIMGNKVPPPIKFVKDGQPPVEPSHGDPSNVVLLPKDPSPAEIPLPRYEPLQKGVQPPNKYEPTSKPEPPTRYVPSSRSEPPPTRYEPTKRQPEPPVRYEPTTRSQPPPTKYEPTVGTNQPTKQPLTKIEEGSPKSEPLPKDELLPKHEPPFPGEEPRDNFGLTLAEVEKYKNDPFWRTLRWILFVLFWLLWILMFLAAILIVALSPGCVAKVAPSWWQSAIAYHIWTPSFQDSDGNGLGDLNGAVDRLENVRRLGVHAVWAAPFLLSDNFNDAIRDHRAIDSKLGVNADGDKFIEAVHDKGMKVVMSMPVGVTSNEHDWFIRSSKASLPENANYSGYYHWRRTGSPPFMSEFKNTSIYYMHYEGKPNWPVINWQNSGLRQEMFDIFSYWIDKGVDGFQLSGIEYLARTSEGNAPNWPAIYDVLRDIKDHVETYANQSKVANGKKIILYAYRDNAKENDKRSLASSGLDSVVNYELGMVGRGNQICYTNEDSVAGCVHELLSDVLSFHKDNEEVIPMWEFGNPSLSRLASRVQSSKQGELLTMIQLLLPGTNSIYYGEEIGMRDLANDSTAIPQRGAMQWDDSRNAGFSTAETPQIDVNPDYKEVNWARQYGQSRSQLKMFQKLAKMRKRDETLAYGDAHIGDLINNGFTLTRYRDEQNSTQGNVSGYCFR